MNSLSWFLYFADVAPGLLTPFVIVSSVCALCWVGVNIIAYAVAGDAYDKNYGKAVQEACSNRLKSKLTYVFVMSWIVTVFVQSLIPSRETFYLIAGSELGEQVIKTPEAQEIFNDIRKVIKQQIKTKENTSEN